MNLNGEWKLYYYDNLETSVESLSELKTNSLVKSITATVPGNVELDLSKAGILPRRPFMGRTRLLQE